MRSGAVQKAAWVGVGAWLLIVAAGMRALVGYEGRAGAVGEAPRKWPARETRLTLDGKVPTLVMFVHPKCPCSEASVEELNRLMARFEGRVTAYVVATRPGEAEAGWEETGLVAEARRVPGVTVVIDDGGTEARRFGARTSGHVDVYEPGGILAYRGGLTGARGHAGDNENLDAVAAVLDGREPATRQGKVFGCSILGTSAMTKGKSE